MSSLTRQRPIEIGPFYLGEIPRPQVFQFLDHNGDPLDLSVGYTAKVTIVRTDGASVALTKNATVSSGVDGEVTYVWQSGDLASVGNWTLVFWVGNGTERLASPEHRGEVRASIATAPTI